MNFQKKASLYRKQSVALNQPFQRIRRGFYNKNEMVVLRNTVSSGLKNFMNLERTNEEQSMSILIPIQELISLLQENNSHINNNLRFKIGNNYTTINQRNLDIIYRSIQDNSIIEDELEGSDKAAIIDILNINNKPELVIAPMINGNRQPRRNGGFFPYLHTLDYDFSRYGLYKEVDKNNYKDNCLIKVLKNLEVPESKINLVKSIVTDRYIPNIKLKDIAKLIQRNIRLTIVKPQTLINTYYFNESDKINKIFENPIEICLYKNHFFINEKTDITSYSIKHYNEVKNEPNWHKITEKLGNGTFKRSTRKTYNLASYRIFTTLEKNGFLEPITNTKDIHTTQYYDKITDFGNLTIDEGDVKLEDREDHKRIFKGQSYQVVYFDFETITEGVSQHKPFQVCSLVQNSDGSVLETKSFTGYDCGLSFIKYLEKLPFKRILMIAHNLRYDMSFIKKYIFLDNIIKTGSKVKLIHAKPRKITRNDCNLTEIMLKDSYAMISSPLAKFGRMFNFELKKEVMPYKIYTEETINRGLANIEDAKKEFKDTSEKLQFELNLRNWNLKRGDDFELIKYAELYCERDVQVLYQGYNHFRNSIKEICKKLKIKEIDIHDMVSLPQISYLVCLYDGNFEGVYKLRGQVREFIQKSVIGGRVMTRDNKKWHCKGVLNDFDGVSLYPSAMVRMDGFLKGTPKVITDEMISNNEVELQDGYFVEIELINVKKYKHFPLITFKDDNGIRQYSNDFRGRVIVDKTTLEDWKKYHEIEYNIIRGYYFNEGHNSRINKTIQTLFEERKKAKPNPIENVYKLLMNAVYGKLIQKPINTDVKFRYGIDKGEKYILNNYNYIKKYIKTEDEHNVEYIFYIQKPINLHYSLPHAGSEILSMSKRIMNEVMCLSEDLDIFMAYTDTDSIHIENGKIELLSKEYTKKYGRELIGKNLGQFHSDFNMGQDNGTTPTSIESYFLGKKSYIDKVKFIKDGEECIDYHIRMKGIPLKCINQHKMDNWGIYKTLYESNKKIKFDLLQCCKFDAKNDFTMANKEIFDRTVSFPGEMVAWED